ncbi:MAG: hypothetical protein PHO41_08025 [Eubacteriales bacterium]|nr:hypothetical protein [Eubacteriales bacterium]
MNTVKNAPAPVRDDSHTTSILESINVFTGERKELMRLKGVVIEAPNWLKTDNALLYNSKGRIWRFDMNDSSVSQVDTAYCTYCNNDHVLSFDHSRLAVSHHTKEDHESRIYILSLREPVPPVLVTPMAPSYLHGWSPDGSTLAYCAERNGQYDIYTIPATGGTETQLTDQPGLDDGPEYAPNGKHIWFNSTRSGLMQVWRMNADGSEQTHMLQEDSNDWFPHVSPDGRLVAFVSYKKGDVAPGDHPANKHVELKLMNADGTNQQTLLPLFGGQGTMNVNSWSPDSTRLAFVRYELN